MYNNGNNGNNAMRNNDNNDDDEEGIIYPHDAHDVHQVVIEGPHQTNQMMPYRMGAQTPQDQGMVCAAMSILLCPPHEGIAREYHELPASQQSQVWSDLTGSQTANVEEESPQIIQGAIRSLMDEIAKIDKKDAFTQALHKHSNYVLDPSVLIRFLRAERFDAALAAQRVVLHFRMKQELFGETDLMGREIEMSDLDEDDWDALERGYMQVVSNRDFSGRRVLFFYKALTNCYRKRENILRVAWYIFNKVAQNPENQKLGIVNLVYNNGGFPEGGMDYEKSRRIGKIMKCIPLRVDGLFVCLDEAPWLAVVEAFSMMVSKFLRIRLRALPGSHTECMYQLMSIGLPYEALPVSPNSNLLLNHHLQWLQEQHQQETKDFELIGHDDICRERKF